MSSLTAASESWPIRGTFTISRGSKTSADVVVAELRDGDHVGRGECVPYARYGESVESVLEQVRALGDDFVDGLDRERLQAVLAPGAARNALDCACIDLDAKRTGRSAAEMLGVPPLAPVVTAYTLSLDTPDAMRAAAAKQAQRPLLKIKLGGAGDLERVRAVREGAPQAALIVDANEGWTQANYTAFAPELRELGVSLIEQPLPASDDAALADIERPVPVCADESCHDRATLSQLVGRYDVINIKLDKTGGLTEALALRDAARAAGLGVMVGCMLGSSLAMAPALLVAQGADFVDLDGPLLLARDREPPIQFVGSDMHPPSPALWG